MRETTYRKLSESEYLATMGDSREKVAPEDPAPFNFWTYFDEIPLKDFNGYDCSDELVEHIWRMDTGRFEHVLISSDDQNVFMVLVLDTEEMKVYGHHLLNLNVLYGLEKNK